MTSTTHTDDSTLCPPANTPVPWYSLHPSHLSRSRLMKAVLIGLLLAIISVVPLWRLLWYVPVYGLRCFMPVRDAHGRWRQAWRWIDGREIRVYQLPEARASYADTTAEGARSLVEELGLDIDVKVVPMPDDVHRAYLDSLVWKKVEGQRLQCLDFGKLESRLIELREGDPHADVLVVAAPLSDATWAHGMATFSSGVCIVEEISVRHHLGRHETGHLLGYLAHDSLPLFVIGYPWEGDPWTRDNLMMLNSQSDELSPRARDALHYFWRGLEDRTKQRFFVRKS